MLRVLCNNVIPGNFEASRRVEAVNTEDDLDDEERAELHAALDEAEGRGGPRRHRRRNLGEA